MNCCAADGGVCCKRLPLEMIDRPIMMGYQQRMKTFVNEVVDGLLLWQLSCWAVVVVK